MLKKEIINKSKTEKVLIFFDMDGVLAEYGAGEKGLILNNTPNFYLNKRPIQTTLKIHLYSLHYFLKLPYIHQYSCTVRKNIILLKLVHF